MTVVMVVAAVVLLLLLREMLSADTGIPTVGSRSRAGGARLRTQPTEARGFLVRGRGLDDRDLDRVAKVAWEVMVMMRVVPGWVAMMRERRGRRRGARRARRSTSGGGSGEKVVGKRSDVFHGVD